MKVLLIDDEPRRAIPLLALGHDVRIAHGFEQIDFYMGPANWWPDFVILDRDMPLMVGEDVIKQFGSIMVFIEKILVWSHNTPKARIMADHLNDIREWKGLPRDVLCIPYTPDPEYWRGIL